MTYMTDQVGHVAEPLYLCLVKDVAAVVRVEYQFLRRVPHESLVLHGVASSLEDGEHRVVALGQVTKLLHTPRLGISDSALRTFDDNGTSAGTSLARPGESMGMDSWGIVRTAMARDRAGCLLLTATQAMTCTKKSCLHAPASIQRD